MGQPRIGLDPRVRELLDASGRPWSVDCGAKHGKLRLEGRLIAIVPRSLRRAEDGPAAQNLLACVRRALRSPPSTAGS